MEILVNDLSIEGQFPDIETFRAAMDRLMKIRTTARRFGKELQCHRNISNAKVTRQLRFPQAIQYFGRDERQAILQWVTRQGPFWEDFRHHGPSDYLEHGGTIVTDTAVGEAAVCTFHGNVRHLASLIPSSWEMSLIVVKWILDEGVHRELKIPNYNNGIDLEKTLRATVDPILSWKHLEEVAQARFASLTFFPGSFEPLDGHPFVQGAARQVLALLNTLDHFKGCFDERGQRTSEGQQIYQAHFTGDKAWFSDSSETEKNEFRNELTFLHPKAATAPLFCSWHGKVKTPQLRIHFSWPVRHDQPLYVVYVGPKLTKR